MAWLLQQRQHAWLCEAQLCDVSALLLRSFHGKDPSKNKKDKRFRKVQEEQERKRRTMSAIGEDHALSRLAAVQEQSATPYLVRPPTGPASLAPPRRC